MIPVRTLSLVLAYTDPASVDRDVTEILEGERYAFCHPDDEDKLYIDEFEFCELVGASSRCPGMLEICTRDARDFEMLEFMPRAGEGGERETKELEDTALNPGAGSEVGEPPPPPPPPPKKIEVPNFLGGIARVLLWALLLGALGYVIWMIFRNRVEGSTGEESEELEDLDMGPETPAVAAAAAAAKEVETDVERLLRRSQSAANLGNYEVAIDNAYAALMRRMEAEQLVEIEQWKTNGDYLLRLRRERPQLYTEVTPVVREVERAQFGTEAPKQSQYRVVYDTVLRLVRRATLPVVAVLAATSLSCSSVEESAKESAEREESRELAGLESGPLGHRAFAQLLRRSDKTVEHRMRTVAQLSASDDAVLLLGGVELKDEEWDSLLKWARGGGNLVIATGGPLPEELGIRSVRDFDLDPQPGGYDEYGNELEDRPATALQLGESWSFQYPEFMEIHVPVRHKLETDDTFAQPLLTRSYRTYAVRVRMDEGWVTVFADPLLFSNAAMAVGDDPLFLMEFFEDNESVEIVDQWASKGADNPVEALKNSHMVPLVLQLLALLMVFYLSRGVAFGRLRDPPRTSRRSFSEHVEALANQYAKARASRFALSMYSGYVLERLREKAGPTAGAGLYDLAEALAVRTGKPETELMQLLVEAAEARDGKASPGDLRGDVRLMRQLAQLLTSASGGRS